MVKFHFVDKVMNSWFKRQTVDTAIYSVLPDPPLSQAIKIAR